ncbi:VWA-like domain-containing protein [Ferrimonas balearica]|uniref:vWA domain-containing protein n=1 Tax=Ferrimonas balearica TaxID=44012 RepID=UPI0021BDA331|nr:VWA-like domain-containing protein [Ferrimonas balearica]
MVNRVGTVIEPLLSRTSVKLMLQEPFYGHYLASFHKVILSQDDRSHAPLESAPRGSSDVELRCRPALWEGLSQTQQLGALKHEALHLVFGHPFMRARYADKGRFDRAADLVANQYLSADQLGSDALTLERLNTWRETQGLDPLEPHKELAYYYQALPPSGGKGPGAGEGVAPPGHESWAEFGQQSEAEGSLARQTLDNKLEQAANRMELDSHQRGRGQIPLAILARVQALLERRRTTLDWRRALRLFANSSRRTSVKNTLRRPSKRYGTTPGTRIIPHQRLLVAVDTSASVNDQQLRAFFDELHHIWRAGAEITVVECDVDIHRDYVYRGIAPTSVSGRGGTDFNAPVAYANKHRFDGIIYFTDGEAPAPTVPPRASLLWLIQGRGSKDDFAHLRSCGRVIPMAALTTD